MVDAPADAPIGKGEPYVDGKGSLPASSSIKVQISINNLRGSWLLDPDLVASSLPFYYVHRITVTLMDLGSMLPMGFSKEKVDRFSGDKTEAQSCTSEVRAPRGCSEDARPRTRRRSSAASPIPPILANRSKDALATPLGPTVPKQWRDALIDLITIFGDSHEAYDSINEINDNQFQAMRRNWRPGASKKELLKRIVGLRLTYDWPALKSVISICPGSATGKFRLNDLFNLLDMHIPPSFGVRALALRRSSGLKRPLQEQFFDARRLIAAKNALLMILIASFYIDYQECISSN
jgi:hypothetical protein